MQETPEEMLIVIGKAFDRSGAENIFMFYC